MQPFMNPNYFNQQYGNYSQPMYRFQPQEPVKQISTIYGGIVSDFSEITANDVPMDGNPAVFVKQDRNEIEVREWCADGQIRRTTYMPKISEEKTQTENTTDNSLNAINDRIDEFEKAFIERFDKLEKAFKQNKRKEGADNE